MRFVIDGNNLVYAYAEMEGTTIGRQRLCEVVGRWASRASAEVVIVFDGPPPPPGVHRQMQHPALDIRFSESRSADEVIEDLIEQADSPANLCIVTSDRAVASAGRRRRCRWIRSQPFAKSLISPPATPAPGGTPVPEKPGAPDPEETEAWLRRFGIPVSDPDDLTNLMS